MALPAHHRYPSRRTQNGTLYTRSDPRAAGWRAEVHHADFGGVTFRVIRPDNPNPPWSSASNVPQAWDRVNVILSHAIMAAARKDAMDAVTRRKYPVVCPSCHAPVGKPCRSASGNKLPEPHVARRSMTRPLAGASR